jgi:hypothetical protein
MELLDGFRQRQGGEMQRSQDQAQKMSPLLLDANGGEPLAGSGFEQEDPEQDFSITELAAEE